PQPESYFVSDGKSAAPKPARWYVPGSRPWSYSPVNGRSVRCSRSRRYCSGESSARHSASVLTTLFGKRSPFLVFACTDRFNVDSLPRSPCHRRGTWRGVMLEAVLHHRLLHGAHLVEPPNGSVVGR